MACLTEGAAHGSELLQKGFSIAQVVHNDGDVCQAITELVVERRIAADREPISTS